MSEMQDQMIRRRDLLALIGAAGGASAAYMAMTTLGFAQESHYRGPVKLQGDPRGASVLILGAGLSGLVSAYELSNAGYKVQMLEYNARPGGRVWTVRGGDTIAELGGAVQKCEFAPSNYLNAGPWRIPYHHHGIRDYCRRLGVKLEPFIHLNFNAYVHDPGFFGGKPQRFSQLFADFKGHTSELLAKAVNKHQLDDAVTKEDQEKLLVALRAWGGLDKNGAYRLSNESAFHRGQLKHAGGGLSGAPTLGQPIKLHDLLHPAVWSTLNASFAYDMHATMFQQAGGMDSLPRAFEKKLGQFIRYQSRVTEIHQDDRGVTVTYEDMTAGGAVKTARADWCICTIPAGILSQIKKNVSPAMEGAIGALPYSPGMKVGIQFKRRFWEQDEGIYGGITYTGLPVENIAYPSANFDDDGPGVLIAAYPHGTTPFEFTTLTPAQRIEKTLADGSQIHPQYRSEFMNGVSIAWHRMPFIMGCGARWTEATREQHYANLCAIDGRFMVAGEHASYLGGWQEGAITSAVDAVERLHRRIMQG
jgi:monoamine oxidase